MVRVPVVGAFDQLVDDCWPLLAELAVLAAGEAEHGCWLSAAVAAELEGEEVVDFVVGQLVVPGSLTVDC